MLKTNKSAAVLSPLRWFSILNESGLSHLGASGLLTAVAVLYLLAYLGHPVLPGNDKIYPQAWWGWWDQSQYLACAADLAYGRLSPQHYWYPLGYPLIGALFYRAAPQHAFLIPNLAFVVGSTVVFYRIARRFISPTETLLLMILFTVCHLKSLSMTLVEPWNTIPTHFFSYLMILLVGLNQPQAKRVLASSLCLGLIYLCRPVDAVCMAPLLGIAILRLAGWGQRLRTGTLASLIVGGFVLAVLGVNYAVFHSWQTPYDRVAKDVGFGSYSILQKLFGLLIDGNPVYREPSAGLVFHYPWLLLIVPGGVYLFRRHTAEAIGIASSLVVTYTLYLLFNELWPSTIFRFHTIHYLFWTIPLLALVTYIGLKEGWKNKTARWSFISIPLLLFIVLFVDLKEHLLGSLAPSSPLTIGSASPGEQPVDWILFEGSYELPKLEVVGRKLRRKNDFEDSLRPDGTVILLSRILRKAAIQIDLQTVEGLREIKYGNLRWGLRSMRGAIIFAGHLRSP